MRKMEEESLFSSKVTNTSSSTSRMYLNSKTTLQTLNESSDEDFQHTQKRLEIEGEERRFLFREKKTDEILSCLNGIAVPSEENKSSSEHKSTNGSTIEEERVVDLWHLRELALSRGGLISSSIRRRAWPKLAGVDNHILKSTSASIPSRFSIELVELTDDDEATIKRDVGRSTWHVEAEIKRFRKRSKLDRRRRQLQQKQQSVDSGTGGDEDNDGDSSTISTGSWNTNCSFEGLLSPRLIPESVQAYNKSINDRVSLPKSSSSQKRRPQEISLLYNILSSVLRSPPNDDEETMNNDNCTTHNTSVDSESPKPNKVTNDDSRLHYYQGLHDIAALVLINLESPSLTSLMINRLSTYHLRDAMRSNFANFQAAIRIVFMPLLQSVDKSLHDYIAVVGGTDDSCIFSLSWILSWFGHDVKDADLASRLYDFFLVSHPTMPIYLSVAFLTFEGNRKRIMSTPCDDDAILYALLKGLPEDLVSVYTEGGEDGILSEEGKEGIMNIIEDLIQTALSYMRQMPPKELLSLAHKYCNGALLSAIELAPSITMLKDPPLWSVAPTAFTDWTLIQQSKAMRELSPESRQDWHKDLRRKHAFQKGSNFGLIDYKNAFIASGLDWNGNRTSVIRKRQQRRLIFVGSGMLVLSFGALYRHKIPLQDPASTFKYTYTQIKREFQLMTSGQRFKSSLEGTKVSSHYLSDENRSNVEKDSGEKNSTPMSVVNEMIEEIDFGTKKNQRIITQKLSLEENNEDETKILVSSRKETEKKDLGELQKKDLEISTLTSNTTLDNNAEIEVKTGQSGDPILLKKGIKERRRFKWIRNFTKSVKNHLKNDAEIMFM